MSRRLSFQRRGRTVLNEAKEEEEGESVMLEPDESHYYKYIMPGRLLGREVEHRPGVRIARREQGRALVIRATLRRICGIAAFSS